MRLLSACFNCRAFGGRGTPRICPLDRTAVLLRDPVAVVKLQLIRVCTSWPGARAVRNASHAPHRALPRPCPYLEMSGSSCEVSTPRLPYHMGKMNSSRIVWTSLGSSFAIFEGCGKCR